MSYQPAIYRQQGGVRFVVASSGSLDVESGGEIDVEAGGKLEVSGTALITTGAKIDLSSGGNFVESGLYTATGAIVGREFSEDATTGATLTNYGVSSIQSTGTAAGNVHTVDAPAVGLEKWIWSELATSSAPATVLTTGSWDGTNHNALFTTGASTLQWLHALAVSTDRWILLGYTTDVTFSTS